MFVYKELALLFHLSTDLPGLLYRFEYLFVLCVCVCVWDCGCMCMCVYILMDYFCLRRETHSNQHLGWTGIIRYVTTMQLVLR